MLTLSPSLINSLLTTAAISAVMSFIFFKLVKSSSPQFLSFLNVYSPKSPTKAKLLGGLGISAGIITSMLSLLTRENIMSRFEESFIYSVLFSTACITIYGYIDDKFETRARHKIILQLISLSFLIFYAADLLASPNHVAVAICIATVIGFLLINGTNLLDGLDTLSIKLGSITSISFIFLGMYCNSALTIQLSVATLAALSIFYFFNRPPAQIYMGEIGSCLIGLIYTAQVVLCYSNLKTYVLGLDAISTILMVISLPVCELGISFLRRMYFKKSPFCGDKLHLHYLVHSKQRLSVTATTNIMALASFAIIVLGYCVMKIVSPFAGLVTVNALYCGIYFGYCHKYWSNNENTSNLVSILEHIPVSAVHLINTAELEKIEVSLRVDERDKKDDQEKTAA